MEGGREGGKEGVMEGGGNREVRVYVSKSCLVNFANFA